MKINKDFNENDDNETIEVTDSVFVNYFLADGITYSFGVLFIQLLDEFNESKGYTSWILSLMTGMTLCSGN